MKINDFLSNYLSEQGDNVDMQNNNIYNDIINMLTNNSNIPNNLMSTLLNNMTNRNKRDENIQNIVYQLYNDKKISP